MIRSRHWQIPLFIIVFFLVLTSGLPAFGKESMNLSIIVAQGKIEGILDTTPVTKQLLKFSPLYLEMRDFNGQEKIAMLPEKLDLSGAKYGFSPKAGDIGIYAPWGNICLFYQDAAYSSGLVYLGKITSGVGIMRAEKGTFMAMWNISAQSEK